MPLYPAHDSADVWAHQTLFALKEEGEPLEVAGVPPDYFSATGQHWGNPVYQWSEHVATRFEWWHERRARQLDCFDLLRIDHFRGLEAYWSIPSEQRADQGRWRHAPGRKLLASFDHSQRQHLVAEDLGHITEEVTALRDDYGLPGMRVLQFGFDGNARNPHLPDACPEHAVIYTGTHDNDTSRGWYESLNSDTRRLVVQTVGHGAWPWPLVDAALHSAANTAIVPLQDYLGLDGRYRMNTPGTAEGNWLWRADPASLDLTLAWRIRTRLEQSGRLQRGNG